MPKMDPVSIIRDQHKVVQGLFKEFEKVETPLERGDIFEAVHTNLLNHTTLEEELFYPAVREAGVKEDVLLEAEEEHHVVDTIMEEIVGMDPADEEYTAKFTVMQENVEHHIEEEETEILKKFAGKLPGELGERMMRRWEELNGANPPQQREPVRVRRSGGRRRKRRAA
ncbi:MAG TPA: hemerythrin domain-containing protein [Dehalococcoidia bacterium]|nr:hemerythrin domain-containing protein [Dehalococcoidia bacterium]